MRVRILSVDCQGRVSTFSPELRIRPADPSPRAGQPNTESSSPARITGSRLDLSPFLRQTVKAQNSANGMEMPFKGGLSYGFVSTAVHQGVQAGACGR